MEHTLFPHPGTAPEGKPKGDSHSNSAKADARSARVSEAGKPADDTRAEGQQVATGHRAAGVKSKGQPKDLTRARTGPHGGSEWGQPRTNPQTKATGKTKASADTGNPADAKKRPRPPSDSGKPGSVGTDNAGRDGGQPQVPVQQDPFDAAWTLVGPRQQGSKPRKGGSGPAKGVPQQKPVLGSKAKRKLSSRQRRKLKERASASNVTPRNKEVKENPVAGPSGSGRPTAGEFKLPRTVGKSTAQGVGTAKEAPAAGKRDRDESSSPRGENKRQRLGTPIITHPEGYASAVKADLVVAVTEAQSGNLSSAQAGQVLEILHKKLLELARVAPEGTSSPLFQGKPTHVDGALQVWCTDSGTLTWLKTSIEGITLPSGEKLVVKRPCDVQRRVRCGIVIPGAFETKDIGTMLRFQNPWAQVRRWLLHRAVKQPRDTFLVVSIPEDVVKALVERERRLGFMLGSVYVKFQGPRGKFTNIPPDPRTDRDSDDEEGEPSPQRTDGSETEALSVTSDGPPESPPGSISEGSVPSAASCLGSDNEEEWTRRIEALVMGDGEEMPDGVPL